MIRVKRGGRIDTEPPGCGTRNPDNINERKVSQRRQLKNAYDLPNRL